MFLAVEQVQQGVAEIVGCLGMWLRAQVVLHIPQTRTSGGLNNVNPCTVRVFRVHATVQTPPYSKHAMYEWSCLLNQWCTKETLGASSREAGEGCL